jgi:hypothetical protein
MENSGVEGFRDRAGRRPQKWDVLQPLVKLSGSGKNLIPSAVEVVWKASIEVPSLNCLSLLINKAEVRAEISRDGILQRQEVILNHFVTTAFQVMNERAPAVLVILTDCPGQKVCAIL